MDSLSKWTGEIIAAVLVAIMAIWTRFSFVKRSDLFDKSGQPIYQSKNGCADAQGACSTMVCSKLDNMDAQRKADIAEIKAAISSADAKREASRSEYTQELITVHEHMAKVRAFMRQHGWNGDS